MIQDDFCPAEAAQSGSHLALLTEFAPLRQQAGHIRQTAVPLGDLLDELSAVLRRVGGDGDRRRLLSLHISRENREHKAGPGLHGRSAAGAAAVSGTGGGTVVRATWPA